MANISVSLPSDGDTIDVADYNTPINTIVNDYNGNIDNDNISATAGIIASKLATGAGGIANSNLNTTTGELGGAWTTYNPTWTTAGTAPSLGNGTLSGAYYKIGKTITFRFYFLTGSTTTFGTSYWKFSLPVNAKTAGQSGGAGSAIAIYHAAGTNSIGLSCYPIETGNIAFDVTAARANVTSVAPWSWTTSGDILYGQITYETV